MTTFDEGISSQSDDQVVESSMTLTDHLRELRSRLVKSALALAVGMVLGWIYYEPLFAVLREPIDQVIVEARGKGQTVQIVVLGVGEAFTLKLKISAVAGIILSSPVWLYQLWRFITPGLRKNERRNAYLFVAGSLPLFLVGVVMAYIFLPKGLSLLFGFTPEGVGNYVEVSKYLSFFLRTVIVFGVGFLTPVVLIALNLVGVLSGKRLMAAWRIIIFSVFVFGAVATPSGDPISMLVLSLPVLGLVVLAIIFCLVNDRRRARRGGEPDYTKWSDDEVSPIPSRDDPDVGSSS